jgi:hypothetical protein
MSRSRRGPIARVGKTAGFDFGARFLHKPFTVMVASLRHAAIAAVTLGLPGSAAGCWGDCAGGGGQAIAPGETFRGVDPRRALALPSQTMPLGWVRTGETTTLTITTGPADGPSQVVYDCAGDPGFMVAAKVALRTDDGRLDGSFTTTLPADVSGTLKLPSAVSGSLSVTTLIGTGVVSDTFLDPAENSIGIHIEVNAAGAGAAYGQGTVSVGGPRDTIIVAYLSPAP